MKKKRRQKIAMLEQQGGQITIPSIIFFFGNQVKTFNSAQVQEQCGSVTSVMTK